MGRVQDKMQSLQRRRKAQRAGRRRNSSPSSPSSEPDSTTVDSPLPDLLRMDVLREESADPQPKVRVLTPVAPVSSAPTPSSPLLTSLLKSPSPAPSSQASILHSAITAQRGASPTIASLLSSAPGAVPPPPSTVSPSLKNLVSSAIANASEEHLKPQNTSPSAGAPTLSMLLELPPSLPGKPLPELPSVARQPAPQLLQAPQTPSMPPAPPAPPAPTAQPLPTPPPPARPSTTPAQEVLQTEQETDKDEEDDGELVEVKFEDLKETVQCDELTDEAVLEMVLATEDIVCTEPANVTIASGAVDVKGSWVRALDFGNEVKEQYDEVGSQNVQKHDGKIIVATHEQVISEPVKETSPEEKNVEDAPETAECDHQVNEEVLVEVIDAEGEKGDDGVVGSEFEVAMKGEQDLTEGYAVNGAEQSGVVVADIEQEVFNIQEVEVPMSETVAEVVEIMGDESQSELLAPVMGDISEQQVLEVIVGPALPASSQDPAVELTEKQDDVKGSDKDKHTDEESDEEVLSSDVNKKVQEVIVDNIEASRLSETPNTKLELMPEKSELGTEESKNGFDSEAVETGKQSGKQKTDDDKVRYRKKKHSKGKKKKHSREKRNDSKSRSKEIDSKTDSKSSEKKEVEKNAQDVTKDKVNSDSKIGVKKKDDKTEIIVQKKEVAKEEKKVIIKEVSPEQVKTSKEGKSMSDIIQKNRSGKEDGKQTKNLNIDKKEKESIKEMKPVSNETDSSRDKLLNSKESSKKDKGSVIEKQYRGHRKGQDVKNEDVPAKEEVPRKDKKDKKDVAHKKSDKSSDSEGGTGSGFLKEPTPAPTDEEDEKPLAEIADEKKLQLVSNILAKEERPTRGTDPQSGEDDKTSDAEPSRVASKKQRAAASTPVDSVPNSPAASFTTDEEREHKAWKKAIMLLYNRLATHKYASLFLRPITNDLAPGYSSYIYRPIDLQMIKKNIETGMIRTTTEFQKEVMRMFKNAIMYNKSLHDVHLMALEMQEECLQHIEEFVATQMLVASVGETPTRRETRTWDANKQREFLRSPRPSSQEDAEPTKPSKRKRNDTSSETPDHTPKRKTAED